MLIDIHTHIIPYVDDGSVDWESSIALLQHGEKEGIVSAVATPHVLSQSDYKYEQDIVSKFDELKDRAKKSGIKMKLYLGSEIYIQPDMKLDHKISTINNNQKYFLVEFPMNSIPRFVAEKFFNFVIDEKIPVIAHPERNMGFMNKMVLAYEFVQRGALMQINAMSILGKQGERIKSLAHRLISNNLAHIVASDCHSPNRRNMALLQAYKLVEKNWGKQTAERLFYNNPQKLINGEKIEILEPIPFEVITEPSLWQKLSEFRLFKK